MIQKTTYSVTVTYSWNINELTEDEASAAVQESIHALIGDTVKVYGDDGEEIEVSSISVVEGAYVAQVSWND